MFSPKQGKVENDFKVSKTHFTYFFCSGSPKEEKNMYTIKF